MAYEAKSGTTDKSSAGREGGKFLQGFPVDHSSHKLSNTKGCKMGGSTTNLSHSLGTTPNMKGPR
jgi:hypothetical protein